MDSLSLLLSLSLLINWIWTNYLLECVHGTANVFELAGRVVRVQSVNGLHRIEEDGIEALVSLQFLRQYTAGIIDEAFG